MDTQKLEIRYEDFVCRIPALFAYAEFDDSGQYIIHKATDNPNGCYGKIIENIHTPSGVRLTNYVKVPYDNIPNGYQWNDSSTIGTSENESTVFSKSLSMFLRKVVYYYYDKTEDEGYNYQYVETLPQDIYDDSPEYIKTNQIGVDGEPVECGVYIIYDYFVKKANYVYFQRKDIIEPCTTYSYRTLIEAYYKYKPIVSNSNSFIKFMETGIGKIWIDKKLLNLTDEKKYTDVPEFIYLSQIKAIKAQYDTLRKASEYYLQHIDSDVKVMGALKAKHEEYIRKGGDNMDNWLSQLLPKAYDVANEYKCHSDNKTFSLRFGMNIMVNKRNNINGVESVYINEFIPGNRYYDGDLLTYNGRTYICVLGKIKKNGNNYPYILKSVNFSKVLYILDITKNKYLKISENSITNIPSNEDVPKVKETDYIVRDSTYYFWTKDTSLPNNGYYKIIDVTEYCTGKWNESTKRYVFDTQHFILLSELTDYDPWYDDTNLIGEDYRYFEEFEYVPSTYISDYVKNGNSMYKWDNETNSYILLCEEKKYEMTEKTNSKLRDLRAFKVYMNELGEPEKPDMNEDWLYYYKIGQVSGLMTETDEVGNIINDSGSYNGICHNLRAYGNILTSITFDEDENTLTFEYVIGGHLTAVYDSHEIDADGNIKRKYKDFAYDEALGDGIHFTETYECSDNTIKNMDSGDFEAYINGNISTMVKYEFEKFPFITNPVTTIDGDKSIIVTGTTIFDSSNNLLFSNTFREEWMTGLYYQPKLKSGISIDRGNGASYERHIRLGEIRTMEDFVNYQNGGYFKINEN